MSRRILSILHADMDAFYAAVEQLDRPELRGRPVLVGGPEGRGVVSAASYEARPFGCRSAMPMAVALRRCPHAVVLPVRMSRYREVSARVFDILGQFSPVVEPLSIDEAFLDLTGTEALFGDAERTGRGLKERIRAETGLAVSVGIAPNKFLAKLASESGKPDGLVVLAPESVQDWLDVLPVERLWGVGPAALRRLQRLGLHTAADVRRASPEALGKEFGDGGRRLQALARGIDHRPVQPDHQARSLSQETTFLEDVVDREHLRSVLLHQVEDTAHRLRRQDLLARTVQVKIRYSDFETLTRAGTLKTPTSLTAALWQPAARIFQEVLGRSTRPVRLIGAGVSGLLPAGESGQLPLLEDEGTARQQALEEAVDRLRARFGPDVVRRRPLPHPPEPE